ncbi:MAG: alpha/beta hydrolase [Flavobacteriia bacterium]|nr:alpha/beta hydrolase [Flavobacteriia bacterium]OJX36947.1 MAG: hypothetical protein BGO87_14285 [Flavobacteriia bacterium 40-80]
MLRVYSLLLLAALFTACKKEKIVATDVVPNPSDTLSHYNPAKSYDLKNLKYGTDSKQILDAYLPANRGSSTKVFVLIHGGGWSAGSKEDFQHFYNGLKQTYPDCAIINIAYRLGTANSPGYPKQINDIDAALKFMQHANFSISKNYCLIGNSAGGHLSMLYGYAFDTEHTVKAIINTVGPADFTDTAYINNIIYEYALTSLVGNVTYSQNPLLYKEVSPALRVSSTSPPTISFYGDQDPLVPSTQVTLLHDQLDAHGIYNEWTLYTGEGHGTWNQTNANDSQNKIINFIQNHFL